MNAVDHACMSRALQLARLGLYTSKPNPRVGCVIVNNGEIVGEGYHRKSGEPHAERLALTVAGDKARGATVYVTLEPCCHHGKTPPCSDALIAAGVSRVVIAMQDPNPLVSGNGMRQLREAGITVESGLLETEAQTLNPGFIHRMTIGRPWVRCKLAMSVDGRIAMASGESQWITSNASRKDVHRLRALSSAIVTGVGTMLADDPSMDVRLDACELAGVSDDVPLVPPLRVIMDRDLRTPASAKMLELPGATLILTKSCQSQRISSLEQAGAEVITLDGNSKQLDWQQVMHELARREINEVLIEAGPRLAGSALQAGMIDELVIYMAPHLMGDSARGLMHLPNLARMADRITLELTDMRQFGVDIRMTYRIVSCSQES